MQEKLDTYRSRAVRPELWAEIAQVVVDLVRAACPADPGRAKNMLGAIAQLVAFHVDRGVPLDPQLILDTDRIAEWVAHGLEGVSERSRANYRAMALRCAEAVLTGVATVRRPQPMSQGEPQRPYTHAEKAALRSAAAAQPTPNLQHNAAVLIAAGFGLGATAVDLDGLRGSHLRRLDDGTVVAEIPGKKARSVACLAEFETILWHLAQEVGDDFVFFPGRAGRLHRNAVGGFAARMAGVDAPRLSLRRARINWLVHHLTIGTPARVVLAAAGVKEFHGLSKYIRFVPEPDQTGDAYLSALRGARP